MLTRPYAQNVHDSPTPTMMRPTINTATPGAKAVIKNADEKNGGGHDHQEGPAQPVGQASAADCAENGPDQHHARHDLLHGRRPMVLHLQEKQSAGDDAGVVAEQ